MKKKQKETEEEYDVRTSIDYLTDKGIIKKKLTSPGEDIFSDWYVDLPKHQQDSILKQAYEEWWKKFGNTYMNEEYNKSWDGDGDGKARFYEMIKDVKKLKKYIGKQAVKIEYVKTDVKDHNGDEFLLMKKKDITELLDKDKKVVNTFLEDGSLDTINNDTNTSSEPGHSNYIEIRYSENSGDDIYGCMQIIDRLQTEQQLWTFELYEQASKLDVGEIQEQKNNLRNLTSE
tara:strand:+ start:3323 stop:4015 length:693 start_codon:yes stop_codon:yes gene_type:complete